MTEKYEILEGCYGKVVGTCQKGAFLTLDNGQEAFAYKLPTYILEHWCSAQCGDWLMNREGC